MDTLDFETLDNVRFEVKYEGLKKETSFKCITNQKDLKTLEINFQDLKESPKAKKPSEIKENA